MLVCLVGYEFSPISISSDESSGKFGEEDLESSSLDDDVRVRLLKMLLLL